MVAPYQRREVEWETGDVDFAGAVFNSMSKHGNIAGADCDGLPVGEKVVVNVASYLGRQV